MLGYWSPDRTAILHSLLLCIVAAFQAGLALGMPWGDFALGGTYPETLPSSMRVAAAAQIPMLLSFGIIGHIRAGFYGKRLFPASRYGMWIVTAIFALSTMLNAITPSAGERLLWLPVAFLLFLTSLRLARATSEPEPSRRP